MKPEIQTQERTEFVAAWQNWYNKLGQLDGPYSNGAKQRDQAFGKFLTLGFPTTSNEEWKYTSVLPLLRKESAPALVPVRPSLSLRQLKNILPKKFKTNRLVFVNGWYSDSLSEILDPEVEAGNSFETDEQPQVPQSDVNAFTCLNDSFFTGGAWVRIKANSKPAHPVHVLFIHDTQGGNTAWHCRNVYRVGSHASLDLIHSSLYLGSGAGLGNVVNDFRLEEGSKLNFSQIQLSSGPFGHIEQTEIYQKANSHSHTITVSGGAEFIRNNLHIRLEGTGAEAFLDGLCMGNGKSHIDNHTLVDHRSPGCNSNELYKCVMTGESKAVFNGKVKVRKDAQKTNAFQSNRNLLLSSNSSVNTKPQLEILADDVKCSHGATIGRLSDEALFYLRSRGLDETEAKNLLVVAFAAEVSNRIHHPAIRNIVEEFLNNLSANSE